MISPPPLQRSALPSQIGHLPNCSYAVTLDVLADDVLETLKSHPDFPGVILMDGSHYAGVLSRQRCFERLARPFGVELFLRRPIRALFEKVHFKPTPLPAHTFIEQAVQSALRRPPGETYEPILMVQERVRLRLVDLHDLLLAHSRLLLSANHVIQQQVKVENQLFRTLEWDPLIERIFSLLAEMVPFDSALLLLDQLDGLQPVAARGLPWNHLPCAIERHSQEYLAYQEIQVTGCPLLRSSHHEAGSGTGGTVRIPRPAQPSWLGLPLTDDGRVFGMLSLSRGAPADFNEDEITIAANFCRQASVAIRNAEQYRAVHVR